MSAPGGDANGVRMRPKASLRFVSLFVPDLAEAARTYEALLGTPPAAGPFPAPAPHPFAAAGPVVFELGSVALALYQVDEKTTHPGDVGFGTETNVDQAAAVIRDQHFHVLRRKFPPVVEFGPPTRASRRRARVWHGGHRKEKSVASHVGKVDAGGQSATRERAAWADLNGPGGLPTDFVP